MGAHTKHSNAQYLQDSSLQCPHSLLQAYCTLPWPTAAQGQRRVHRCSLEKPAWSQWSNEHMLESLVRVHVHVHDLACAQRDLHITRTQSAQMHGMSTLNAVQ